MRRRRHAAPQLRRHRLHAIADAEDRHVQLEDGLRNPRRIVEIDGFRAARQDDAGRRERFQCRFIHVPGMYLGIDARLADAARDQLRILSAEVQDQDALGVDVGLGCR